MVLFNDYRECFSTRKCLVYLFGIGGFGRLVSGRPSPSGVQRRLAGHRRTQGTTGHGGRFASAVTQLVEATLQPAVTTTAVLWCIFNSEHHRLSPLGLQMNEREKKQKYCYYEIHSLTT